MPAESAARAAARLREDGCRVVVFDRVAPADPVDLFVEVELSDTAATARALERALDGRRITRLVNNVGTVRPALLEDATLADFDDLMALNVRCAIQCAKALTPGMRAEKFGRIVNLSSRSVLGKALRTNYAATKAALIGLTRTWALELAADGITVNCICPGPDGDRALRRREPARFSLHPGGARRHPGRPHRHARGHGARHRLLPRPAQRLRYRTGAHGLRRLQPRRPRARRPRRPRGSVRFSLRRAPAQNRKRAHPGAYRGRSARVAYRFAPKAPV